MPNPDSKNPRVHSGSINQEFEQEYGSLSKKVRELREYL